MPENDIRLQYSGFVVFVAQLLSVGTGLFFQLMIARASTNPKLEYDIWFNIKDMLAYFTFLAVVLPFWTLRFVARGREGTVKTGILANLTVAIISTIAYISLVSLITSALNIKEEYFFLYFLSAIQIIENYSISVLEPCLQARMPQVIGYGLLVRETCKVTLGYILINRFQPLYGAMISLIVAFTIQVIYYFRLLWKELKQKVRWDYLKEWLKGSIVNIYNVVGNQIALYIFILLFSYGGEGARGNYGAAALIAAIISYSSFLGFALYPKLLAERKREDITTSMKFILMFAIPMTAGAIALSDSYLSMLTVEFGEATPVLVVLAIDALLGTVSGLYGSVLLGFEKIDEQAKISFRELIRSRMFIAFSLPYLHSLITLPTTFYVLTTYALNDVEAALCVGIINSSARFAMFLILYTIVHKIITVDIPWRNIARYVFASAVMATSLFVIPHPKTILLTLVVTIIGGIVYLALLMAIDREARVLAVTLWQETMTKVKGII